MINVRDFGARGDGTTNDTKAVQTAIKFGDGNKLFFPPGKYACDELYLGNIHLIGEGASLIKYSPSGMLVVINGEAVLQDLNIDGAGKSAMGVRVQRQSKNVAIIGCNVHGMVESTGWTSTGIHLEGSIENIVIDRCHIHDIQGSTSGVSRGIRGSGYGDQPPIHNLLIRGCWFDHIGPEANSDAIVLQDWSLPLYARIVDNYFTGMMHRAIKIMSPGVVATGNQWMLSGNPYSFISVYASDVIVDSNMMLGGETYIGIEAGTTSWTSKHVVITNNILRSDEAVTAAYTDLIRTQGTIDGIVIRNNILEKCRFGVHLSVGTTNAMTEGNIVKECKQAFVQDA